MTIKPDTVTIVHWTLTDRPSVYRGFRPANQADRAYALGYREPRYPVPTLIIGVSLEPDRVSVWEREASNCIETVWACYDDNMPTEEGPLSTNAIARLPHYPVPTVMQGMYCLASTISDTYDKSVIWFADGTTLVF